MGQPREILQIKTFNTEAETNEFLSCIDKDLIISISTTAAGHHPHNSWWTCTVTYKIYKRDLAEFCAPAWEPPNAK